MSARIGGGRMTTKRGTSGFSLIELLVVLAILVIVMAIIIPVLGHARNAARKAATSATIADLTASCGAFRNDQRREPGYFSLADMGHADNKDYGFTTMNNVLIDLCGGLATGRENTDATAPVVKVGPNADALVLFDKRLMALDDSAKSPGSGGSGGGYFRPGTALMDWKFYEKTVGSPSSMTSQQLLQQKYLNARPANRVMPDLVDAWGSPILGWGVDTSLSPADAAGGFGKEDSSTPGRALVYWAQNAAFLKATKTASRSGSGANQQELSLLGVNNLSNVNANLQALLGNPSYPDPSDPSKPAAARGPLVFQSAGPDAVYMGKEDRGGKKAGGTAAAYTSTTGTDAMFDFDDLIFSAGQ